MVYSISALRQGLSQFANRYIVKLLKRNVIKEKSQNKLMLIKQNLLCLQLNNDKHVHNTLGKYIKISVECIIR